VVSTAVLIAYLLTAFGIFWSYLFLSGLFWGSGWSPTPRRQLDAAAHLLQLKEGDTVYDLGSGFGRALIFFAKEHKVLAVGIEIDPLRRLITMWGARRQGIDPSIYVRRENLLDADLSGASKIFFFLTPLIMRRLQEKLARELRYGTLIASVDHRFPDWKPVRSLENVHLYIAGRDQG
jgi:SAM-dependent methyltransferase